MNQSDEQINQQRRELLKGFTKAAVVGGVVAAGLSTTQSLAKNNAPQAKTVLKKGYHETQHIRDYFDSL